MKLESQTEFLAYLLLNTDSGHRLELDLTHFKNFYSLCEK